MREILFRAKAINRDKGYHRSNYKNGDWVYGLISRLYDERFENLPAEMTDIIGISGIEVDYKTIGQYTGLTDKNGKKIFEGDYWIDTDDGTIFVVEFRNSQFCFVLYDFLPLLTENGCYEDAGGFGECDCVPMLDYYIEEIEIKGNIHDNPELLKGGVE